MDYQQLSSSLGLVLVEIDGSGIKPGRTYTDKTTGQQRPLPGQQTAYFWQGGKYPTEVALDVPDVGPYRPGWYFLGGSVFASGDYSRLNFKGGRELSLVSVDEVFDRAALAAAPKQPKAA